MVKKNIAFMLGLFALLILSGISLVPAVSAISLSISQTNNASFAFAVIAGGNVSFNVTTSNESNPQTPNGGYAANVSLWSFCERNTAPTVIASRLNTSTNQTGFSFGVNVTALEDCNRTIMFRASNQTSGATIIHVGGESNVSDVYFNSTTLDATFVTADNTNQETDNSSFSLVLTTDEQASNVTAVINAQSITLARTNSSGRRWSGSLINLPENTYTYTVNVRDPANDLKIYSRSVTIVTTGQGKAYGAFGVPLLAPKPTDGTTPGTTTQGQTNNYLMIGGIILAIWFFFGR